SLFQHPTIEAFAALLDATATDVAVTAVPTVVPRAVDEPPFAGLSSTERRVWFLDRLEPEGLAYAVWHGLRYRGVLAPAALRVSLAALAARHEILRTTYPDVDGAPVRRV